MADKPAGAPACSPPPRPPRRLLERIGLLLAMALTGTFAFVSGETTSVTPPANVSDPTTVILGLFGKHTSLFLPTPDGQMEEFAFGDWDYFVLNDVRWWSGPRALLFSTGSALGRRTLKMRTDDPRAIEFIKEPDSIPLRVSAAKAEKLRQFLEERFATRRETMVFNTESGLENIRDGEHYAMGNNCNNVAAQWLLALGCDVHGVALTSNFELGKR